MIKPIKPKILKILPEIELEPLSNGNWDELKITFTNKGLNINAIIDGCGNDFFLDYKKLEEYLK